MVVNASELGGTDDLEHLQSQWVQTEIDPADSYLKAEGIYHNLLAYLGGEKDDFRAYFVKEIAFQRDVERHFLRLLKLAEAPALAETPSVIAEANGVYLYGWSNFIGEKAFDTYYEACRGNEMPVYYRQALWEPVTKPDPSATA